MTHSVTAWASDTTLQWNSNDDAEYYIVYWRTADDSEPIDQSEPIDAGTTSFPLYPSDENIEYFYSVKAFNSCGDSSVYSDEVVSTLSPYEPALKSSPVPDTYSAEISRPTSSILESGVLIDFSANIYINNVLTSYENVTWTSSVDGLIGTGADLSTTLTAGIHTVLVSVSDGENDVASDTMIINVLESNTSPTVTITSADSGILDENGHTFTFVGQATDLEDGNLSTSIAWLSDLDGGLGVGAGISAVLSPGNHTITARVTDSHGQIVEDSTTVTALKWDAPPTLSIQAAANGDSNPSGQEYTLTGVAKDDENGDLSANISWSSSINNDLGTGGCLKPTLSVGTHTITATVSDSAGQSVTKQLEVTVLAYNYYPELSMSMELSGEVTADGQPVLLSGSALDVEDGDISSSICWSSSIDNALGTGKSLEVILASGTHSITARITDSKGQATEMQQSITIAAYNNPPDLSIYTSSAGELTADGQAYTLSGYAQDIEDNDLSSTIAWTSSLKGDLGSGSSLSVMLSSGSHIITAQVTDSGGKVSVLQKTITVGTYNYAPVLNVSYTATGTLGPAGLEYTFTGSALDSEEGDLSDAIVWTSSLTGELGTGATVPATLKAGTHIITARVTDKQGKLAEAQQTITVNDFNYEPELTIQTTVAGELGQDGQPYTLSGSATDYEDGDLSGSISWSSNIDDALGTGASITFTLSAGIHTITARVTDKNGVEVEATKSINISEFNNAPSITIISSTPGELGPEGQPYSFMAYADDQEDGDLSSITWSSSIDKALGTGTSVNATLTSGSHTITATVTDSGGKTASATKSVTVADYDYPPEITIISSTAGELGPAGQAYQFKASAADHEDGSLASITWTSSRDGELGTGTTVNPTLSTGSHTVTASVSDSAGKTVSTTAQVEVAAYDYPPEVTIISVMAGVSGPEGQAYQLTGSAQDKENGNLSSSISWTSSRDGDLATGATINVSLSSGTHTITARVTDSQGQTAQTTQTVEVDPYNNQPEVTITSAAAGTLTSSGQPYTFTATASDQEDDDLSGSILWTSSTSGTIGSGSSVSLILAPGDHTIRAQVSDSGGKSAIDTRAISVEAFDFKPSIQILNALEGEKDDTGQAFTLSASSEDEEDGNLSAQITWSSNLQGSLGTGAGIPVHLKEGTHSITATITDSFGNQSSASTVVTSVAMDYPPFLSSITITGGKATKDGQLFTFSCSASDQEDGGLNANITWSSSAVGALGSGFMTQALIPLGTHTVTARVTDSKGQTTEKTQDFTAAWVNQDPTVQILSIEEGAEGTEGQVFIFTGSAMDEEDGDLSGSIVWMSDRDGEIGEGNDVIVTLSEGVHIITALIIDQDGGEVQTGTSVTVEHFNAAPVVDILSVIAQSSNENGQMFELTGTASDDADGNLSGAIVWTSDRDGVFGTGAQVQALLSGGEHTIRAQVTDSGNKQDEQTMTITARADTGITVQVSSKSFYYFKIITVSWSGAMSDVVILKNGKTLSSGGPDGTKYFWFAGAGIYKVCEINGGDCSEEITIK